MDSLSNGILEDLYAWLRAEHPHLRLTLDIVAPSEAGRAPDHPLAVEASTSLAKVSGHALVSQSTMLPNSEPVMTIWP